MRTSGFAALCFYVALAAADVKVERTINTLAPSITFNFSTAGASCESTDAHGCSKLDLRWGTNISAYIDLQTMAIMAGTKIVLKATVESILPLDVTCLACGANCTFKIPIINTPVTIPFPPCPISPLSLMQSFVIPMPAKSPIPLSVPITANAKLLDPSGATLADVDLTATLAPSGEAFRLDRAALMEYLAQHPDTAAQ